MAKKKNKNTAGTLSVKQTGRQTAAAAFTALAGFFVMCLTASNTLKGLGLGMALLTLGAVCLVFGKLRERMIDLRSGRTVFVGGGSILLKKQIEASGKVSAPIFMEEISANTKGYELLFKAACVG